jgi:tRNA (cmo5U34)-methyltransferase
VHDAATCILVSQFIVDQRARVDLFREIAHRLKPGALLASADLASDVDSDEYEVLLGAWMEMMAASAFTQEDIDRVRNSYRSDVAVLPASTIATIITSAGFDTPVQFFQAGLIAAWISRRQQPST